MHKLRTIISTAFALTFVLMAFTSISFAVDDGDSAAKEVAEWSFMIYMDADNNLESAGVHDMNEMEMVGSSDKVNIVVQMDRSPDYDTTNGDWTTTKRFLVTKDSGLNDEMISDELMDIGEANMGNASTVVDFVKWAVDNYPAKKYLLDYWDHGGAFWGAEWDETDQVDGKADYLTMPEIKTAMQGVEEIIGRNIDIIAFDACLMGELEVQYQFKDVADIGIGSGYVEPGEGWPYDTIMPQLVADPAMTPPELATVIVNEYVNSYRDGQSDPQDTTAITMAAFDLKQFNELGFAVNQFADALAVHASWVPVMGQGGHWFQMEQARQDTNSYDFGYGVQAAPGNQFPIDPTGYCMYDVIDLANNMKYYIPRETDIGQGADATSQAAQATIIHARVAGKDEVRKGANGLTIYYPSGYDTQYSTKFDDMDFAIDTFWDEFLKAYVVKTSVDRTPPQVVISSPADDAKFDIGTGQVVVQGKAFDLQGELQYVEASIDGGDWTKVNGTETWTFKFDTTTAGLGNHTISVRAFDGTENSPEMSVKVMVVAPKKGTPSFVSGGNLFIPITLVALAVAVVLVLVITARYYVWRNGQKGMDDGEADGFEDEHEPPPRRHKGPANGGSGR